MKAIKHITLKNPIILIKLLENDELLVVDEETTIRYYNPTTFALVSGFKANIKHERFKTDVVAFSNYGDFFATISADCKESRLYSTSNKKIIAKMNRHQGEVSCVGIDPKNRYMFSCGDDGKTFAVDIYSGKLAFTLPGHIDTVNDIAFSPNANWVATASYDRNISIMNLSTMTPKERLKIHSSPVMKLKFVGNSRVVSIDKTSNIYVWNVHNGEILAKLTGLHDDVTQTTISEKDQFLFLGTTLGYIIAYNLKTYQLISRNFIKLSSAITALEFNSSNNQLIIGTMNGEVCFYDIYEGQERLQELLILKKYDEIQKQSEINPFLAYTRIHQLVSGLWDKTLTQAKLFLEKGDKKSANHLFSNFLNIPAKKTIIQKTLLEYADFDKFLLLAKHEKYPLAYGMVNSHPMYKETKVYKILEARWKKAFTLAQKYALDIKGTEKAKEILAPYRGISEKTKLIQELMTQGKVYKRFRVALGQKDFRLVFELIRFHPFLMEFEEYETLMRYADSLYMKSQALIASGDTHETLKLLKILRDFSDFSDEVKNLTIKMETTQKFFNAVNVDDIILAYNILDSDEDLQNTPEGKVLQEKWDKDLASANEFAAKGDVSRIIQTLKPYIKISSKNMSFATIFGWCYMVQLENAIKTKKDKIVIENGIKNYILNFGLQDQLESFFNIFMKYYPESKLTLEAQTKGSMTMWRPAMIVKSILE